MKLNTRKRLYALAFSAVAGALPGLAAALPIIGGIDIGPGPFRFVSSTIMERQQGTTNGTITAAGQLLEGVGQVTQIFSGATLVWSNGQNGRELTFRFHDYLATTVSAAHDTFTGGLIDFFSDTARNANFGSTGVGSFIDGNAWLSLRGVEFNPGTPGGNRTLDSTGTLLGSSISGTGIGLLEVTGGPAGAPFNTNSQIAVGTGNVADFELNSSFNNSRSPFGFGTHGVASLSQNAAVPEPAPLALLSLGLFGIGMMSRFKKRS